MGHFGYEVGERPLLISRLIWCVLLPPRERINLHFLVYVLIILSLQATNHMLLMHRQIRQTLSLLLEAVPGVEAVRLFLGVVFADVFAEVLHILLIRLPLHRILHLLILAHPIKIDFFKFKNYCCVSKRNIN